MKIISLNHITPGGSHAWYDTDLGFAIRKQIGDHVGKVLAEVSIEAKKQPTLIERMVKAFKK